jgi:hypothetical protein
MAGVADPFAGDGDRIDVGRHSLGDAAVLELGDEFVRRSGSRRGRATRPVSRCRGPRWAVAHRDVLGAHDAGEAVGHLGQLDESGGTLAVGELRPLSQSRTVLRLAPVAAAISLSLRWATARTREVSRVSADRTKHVSGTGRSRGSAAVVERRRALRARVLRQPIVNQPRKMPVETAAKKSDLQGFSSG